jgi:hypothetical protein
VDPAPLLAPPLPPSTCRTRRRRRASLLSWGCRTSCITRCFGTRGHRSIWSLQVVGNKKMTCETKAEGRTTPHRQKLAFSSCRQFLDTVMTNTVFFLPKIITEMPSTWPRKCFFSFLSFFLTSMFQTLSSALTHRDLFLFTSALVVYRLDSSILTYRV